MTQKLSQKRTLLGLLLLDGVDGVHVLASKIIVAITIMKSHLNFSFPTRPQDTWWSTFGIVVSMCPKKLMKARRKVEIWVWKKYCECEVVEVWESNCTNHLILMKVVISSIYSNLQAEMWFENKNKIGGCRPRICKIIDITRTIFFKLFLDVSQICYIRTIRIGKKIQEG